MLPSDEPALAGDEPALRDEAVLRAFCARILGWENDIAVDHALRSIDLAADYCAALVLLGETDLVPIAHALHRRTLGADRPFIVCDPHRANTRSSVRLPANHETGGAAFQAARGGSLCVRRKRLPRDFSSVVARLRSTDDVQLIVCSDGRDDAHPVLAHRVPIREPSLLVRAHELPQIIDEFAIDAVAELGALGASFTAADHQWVLDHTPWTLGEIEKATLRLVAIRASRNMSNAAARLGRAPVSLSRWVGRRNLPGCFRQSSDASPARRRSIPAGSRACLRSFARNERLAARACPIGGGHVAPEGHRPRSPRRRNGALLHGF